MVRYCAAVSALLAPLALSSLLWAKGTPVMIEIKGRNLAVPIRITAPRLLHQFTVLDGPGNNFVKLKDAETGSIIDWRAGVVAHAPDGTQRYEVSFTEDFGVVCRGPAPSNCATEKPRIIYVVSYAYDPSSKQGFVYLPGKGEPWHDLNIGTIYRPEAEGHWFKATGSWVSVVAPLIAGAQARR